MSRGATSNGRLIRMDTYGLRREIDRCLASGSAGEVRALLAQLWRENQGPALAPFIVDRFEQIRARVPVTPCRLAILRSFTVEPIVPVLRAAAGVDGIDLTVHVGDFNAYPREILDDRSALYGFGPDVVFLAVQTRDIAPELWERFCDLSPAEVAAAVARVTEDIQSLVKAFRSRSSAHLVVHGLEAPPVPRHGVLDAQLEMTQADVVRSINTSLAHLARQTPGVYLLDYDALVARHGRLAWHDERRWLTTRMPIATSSLMHLVNEWLRFLHPLTGRVCKVLVTDLDNTLWGGVIGEDGVTGIAVGRDYPGAAYLALQRAILDLYRRGVILAIASKNNWTEVQDAFAHHPGMLLRLHHFAALRVNWQDKAQNLVEIAHELNVGVDSLAFLDDSPIERQRVRQALPDVSVIELPDDAMHYAAALQGHPLFERLGISDEDRERGRYYAEDRQRADLQDSTASLEDFYRSLHMESEIALVTPETCPRVAQLTQKTNQFNLTTRRYSEPQILDMATRRHCRVYSVRLADRFGDNGIVGVLILHIRDDDAEIDTLLLSCRVIGRTLETALLATAAEQARASGVTRLIGCYVPTKKNTQVKDFYGRHGFKCTVDDPGVTRWELDLARETLAAPPWITRHVVTKGRER